MKSPRHILVLTYWSFDSPLISSYTLPYLRLIRKIIGEQGTVTLVTLSPAASDKSAFVKFRESLSADGIEIINFLYEPFGIRMLLRIPSIIFSLSRTIKKRGITHLHGWCTPGGAFAYLLSLLTARTVVLDSFEPHAESMVETGTWKKNGFAFRTLFRLEKLQLLRARTVIYAASGMARYSAEKYGVIKKSTFVKPACVDLEKFKPSLETNYIEGLQPGHLICVYAGKFGGIYLEQEVFDFFSVAYGYWGERFRVLLLTPHSKSQVDEWCRKAGLPEDAVVITSVSHNRVPALMKLGDFGICPVKPVETKKYCTPIKNGEYWALGLPVVITSGISDDSEIITNNNAGYVLKELSSAEYGNAVAKIDSLLGDPEHRNRIRELAVKYRDYSVAEKIYQAIYA